MQGDQDDVGAGGAAAPPLEPRSQDPPAPRAGAAPRPVPPVVVPRWIQLVVLPLAILGAWALLRAAGPVTLLFIVAALIALLLNPVVTFLQARRVPRGAAVAITFLSLIVVLGGL